MKTITFTGKGGSGKTTTVANIAAFASLSGLRVGVIDTDPQGSASLWKSLRKQANIAIRSCSAAKAEVAVELARRSRYDLVLIDTPAPLDQTTELTMDLADFVCVMTLPYIFDLAVTMPRVEIARRLQVDYAVIVNRARSPRLGIDAPDVADLRIFLDERGANYWYRQISDRRAIPIALAAGQSVAEMDPNSPAAGEYRRLWAVIKSRLERSVHAAVEA